MVNLLNPKPSILFIVEGASAEPKIIKKICSVIGNDDYHVYSYMTTIYELYDELKSDEDLDILLLLREREKDQSKKMLFDFKYTRIYLIFDYDPHYQKFDHLKVIEMLKFFTDSTEQGKLYINYPMMESHRHLKSMPDKEFLSRTINNDEIKNYKKVVGDFTCYFDLLKYDYHIIREMVAHHLIKFNFLLNGVKRLPDKYYYDHWSETEDIKLANLQHDKYIKGELFVLNTSIFYVVDIKPKSFFNSAFSSYHFD